MEINYEIYIYAIHLNERTGAAIEIRATAPLDRKRRRYYMGFGFDEPRKAYQKSILLAVSCCRYLNSTFKIYVNDAYDIDSPKLLYLLRKLKFYEIIESDASSYLKKEAMASINVTKLEHMDV